MICLSETYLDSSFADDELRLYFKGFTFIRENNPHNYKRGEISTFGCSPCECSKFR